MSEALLLRGDEIPASLRGPGPVSTLSDLAVEFLDASNPRDLAAWIDMWKEWPGREVKAHPAYVRLFARPGDRVVCAAGRLAGGGILYPLIVRPLASEPWADPGSRKCDLTNAYGYGGPYAWNVSEFESQIFWGRFDAWARSLGAVTTFSRLSLFPEQMIPFHGELRERGANIVRRLDVTPEELWSDYEGKVRKNVQRARREGLEVRFDTQGNRVDDFIEIYESTMDRRGALRQYYFPRTFFESIITDLPGQFLFACVMAGDRVVSSEIILISAETAYFFLGGTRAEAFALRPNDLLKHESFLRCRGMGIQRFVLGGGYGADDGLLRYKRSFAPTGERPFHTGVITYDAEEAARLVERRREWERGQGREWNPAEGFFPGYRS